MGKYPNVGKILEIVHIDKEKMRLSDESKWQFLPTMTPPAVWKVGDQVRPEELGGFKSEVLYRITGITKKGTDTQAYYLGGAKGESTDINVTKSLTDTEYPEAYLGKPWKIKEATDNIIVLEETSVWKLSAAAILDVNPRKIQGWQAGQYVTISKSGKLYQVKNENVGGILSGTFEGWER